MTFRCTSKTQKRLGIRRSELGDPAVAPSAMDWHCNVLTLARRPFFLLAHTLSLFAFLMPAAGNSSPDSFAAAFREQALEALTAEGFALKHIQKVVDGGPHVFCAATDRRVLGSMVDLAHMSRFVVEDEGGVELARIRQDINESPMSVLGMASPRRVLRGLLAPQGAA